MKAYLLDVNVLVALLWPSHDRHDVAIQWFVRHRAKGWATCPLTQLGFVRVVSNPAFSRDAVLPTEAAALLEANTAAEDHTFWPDNLSFADASSHVGVRLAGHQQVTDAYLLGLAIRHDGVLATLDAGIASLSPPKSKAAKALQIIA